MNCISKLGWAALCSVAVVSVGIAQSGPVGPQAQAAAAVKLRKAVFDVQSAAFAPMGAFLKGAPFDAAAAVTAAQRVEMTSSMIPDVFKFDTRNAKVVTKARDAIWTNMSDFTQKAHDLHEAAVNLEAAAKSGDAAMTKQAAMAVGKACGSCHDEFRSK